MGKPRKLRNLVGILKDKVSLIKATFLLSSSKPTTSFHVAVLRATAHHHPTEPPPEYIVDDVLSLGHHHRPTAFFLVDVLLRRLHRTHSAYVALKCLITLHHILNRGSAVLKDQFSNATTNGIGPHDSALDLSAFRDESDSDTWELSKWVRWYADVLRQSLILSPLTGRQSQISGGERDCTISVLNVLRELSSLVVVVEEICKAPESLHYQRISLVYEVMKLVGEDYRINLREIYTRVTQISERIDDLNDDELKELSIDLRKLEDCKEKVFLMFLNKKKNDGAWDLIAQLRRDVERITQRRESLALVRFQKSESTRLQGSRVDESRSLAMVSPPVPTRKKRWLDVDWNPLVAVS